MKCFICNEPLTEQNASDEHIILNSLGGHLHSKNLLCKKCNNTLGKQSDAALAESLKFAASQLNVKRCRGENQVIQTSEDAKYDLAPGNKPILKKPVFDKTQLPDGKIKLELEARSTQEARKILKALKKQYPSLDIDKVMECAKKKKEFINESVNMEIFFDGDSIFPSIVKTSIEFYLLRGGEREYIEHLIPYVLGKQDLPICWYYYPETPVISLEKSQICHVICVVGDMEEKVLYGYVDLFGILQCLVLLNDKYSGENFFESYVYDVNLVKELEQVPVIHLSRTNVQQSVNGNESSYVTGLKRQITLFQQKANSIIREQILSDMWERALDNSLKKYPEDVLISEEMIKELLDEMEKEIIPWIANMIMRKTISSQ